MIINANILGKQVDPEEYHARNRCIKRGEVNYIMSRGELVEFAKCPHRWKSGYKDGQESNESLEWGSLIDTLLLDRERFEQKYAVAPMTYIAESGKDKGKEKPWNWNAKVCQRWKDSQNGKQIIKVGRRTDAQLAILEFTCNHDIVEIISSSDKQVMVSGGYEDDETGITIPICALIDIVPQLTRYSDSLMDLKTSNSADSRSWPSSVFRYGYHVQSAFYLDLYNAATGENRANFRHIIQESFPPYEIGKRILAKEFIDLGREKYLSALKQYCQCIKSNHWPTYEEMEDYHIDGWGIVDPEAWMI